MATKKTSGSRGRSERKADEEARSRPSPAARGATSAKGTMSGPAGKSKLSPHRGLTERAAKALGSGSSSESDTVRRAAVTDRLQAKADATEELSRALSVNLTKPTEYALEDTIQVPEGEYRAPDNLDATASTITETNENDKNGPKAEPGTNPNTSPLARQTPTYHGPPIPSSIRIETRYPADPRRMVSLRITLIDHGGNEFEMSPRDLSDSESITLLIEDLCKDEVK